MIKLLHKVSTTLLLALMGVAGLYDFIGHKAVLKYSAHLGYPDYFIHWVGACKLIGVLVFLIKPTLRAKEWIYAGFIFDMGSGFVSHLSCHDPLNITLLPVFGIFLWSISYFSYRFMENKTKH